MTLFLELQVRCIISSAPSAQFQENDFVPCTLRLTFLNLIDDSLFNNLSTQGYYLNFSTYSDDNGEVGISLNTNDRSSYVPEKDNWTIKAKSISRTEV